MIQFTNLRKTFKSPIIQEGRLAGVFSRPYKDKKAVRDISFNMAQGDFVGKLSTEYMKGRCFGQTVYGRMRE